MRAAKYLVLPLLLAFSAGPGSAQMDHHEIEATVSGMFLDATTGQNGLLQARAFDEAAGLTAIALTKLDSTSRGGVVFAIERTIVQPADQHFRAQGLGLQGHAG